MFANFGIQNQLIRLKQVYVWHLGQNGDSISQIKCYYKFKSFACNEWKRKEEKKHFHTQFDKNHRNKWQRKKNRRIKCKFSVCADFSVIESGELQITRLIQRSIGYHD